jgi:hypothetical protein
VKTGLLISILICIIWSWLFRPLGSASKTETKFQTMNILYLKIRDFLTSNNYLIAVGCRFGACGQQFFFTFRIIIYLENIFQEIYVFVKIGLCHLKSLKRLRFMCTYIWPIYVLYNRQFTSSLNFLIFLLLLLAIAQIQKLDIGIELKY